MHSAKLLSLFTAIGTCTSSVVAITLALLAYSKPKLKIELLDSSEETLITHNDSKKAFYLHINVSNSNKLKTARKVNVVVTRLSKRKSDGSIYSYKNGAIPLNWQYCKNKNEYLKSTPNIGPNRIFDIGLLIEDSKFSISILDIGLSDITSNWNLDKNEYMKIAVMAVAENSQSKEYYYKISWDGKWSHDVKEIVNHLKIRTTSRF